MLDGRIEANVLSGADGVIGVEQCLHGALIGERLGDASGDAIAGDVGQ